VSGRLRTPRDGLAAIVLWLALAWTTATLAADSLEAIPLNFRTAEELIPVLQPLVPAGAALTGTGDMLLVRADASTLAQVRAAIAELDRAPRQLLITVGQSTGLNRSDAGVTGSATVGSGDVQVGVNRPPAAGTGAEVLVHGGTSRNDIRSLSSIRTLEGYEAYVTIGESRPFTSTTVSGGYHGPVVSESTGYRDVRTGFYAVPRVSGDRVTLEISPVQQRYAGPGRGATVATQSVATVVSGRLGEWIEIGGSSETSSGASTGLIRWGARSELTQYSAWVKVDEVR
jgi:hypothetical protein